MPFTIPSFVSTTPAFVSQTATNVREATLEAIAAHRPLRGADLRDADLSGAAQVGADLRGADLSGADLSGADLSGSVLRGSVLRNADLRNADLRDADLRDAVLRDADLRGADLRDADLRDADLRGADLRDTVGFNVESVSGKASLVPKIEKIHQRLLAQINSQGCALDMSNWHSCETTHCRAGWIIVMAGDEGLALECRIGPAAAAMRIYLHSDPEIELLPNWHASNEEAMADIIACAERERLAVGPL